MEIPAPRPSLILIDNFDSFTYNLWDYFLRLGASCQVIRADRVCVEEIKSSAYDGIILSPGPQRPRDSSGLMACLEACCHSMPMLGICLGHQAIGEFFGASLVKARAPVHGKTSRIRHNGDTIFTDIPAEFSVMRYHSLILEDLPEELEGIAWTAEGEIMALRHKRLPLYGIQFHPESILTEYGLELLENWMQAVFSPVQTVPRL